MLFRTRARTSADGAEALWLTPPFEGGLGAVGLACACECEGPEGRGYAWLSDLEGVSYTPSCLWPLLCFGAIWIGLLRLECQG